MKLDATQIILIVFIVLLIIIYPIMMFSKNKKENQRMLEQTNSLKRGDKVLTSSGVYGTIVDLQLQEDKKIVTIETGTEKKKGYISVDAYAIYQIFKDETKEPEKSENAEKPVDEKTEENKQLENSEVSVDASTENTEMPVDVNPDEETVKQEETKPEKKAGRKSRKASKAKEESGPEVAEAPTDTDNADGEQN